MTRESWTDECLDDLNRRVEEGFVRVEHRFELVDKQFELVDKRFDEVNRKFGEVERRLDGVEGQIKELRTQMNGGFARIDERDERLQARLDSIQRAIAFMAIGLTTAVLAGFAAMAAVFGG